MRTSSLVLLLLLSVLSGAAAQVQTEWVARQDGPDSYNDVSYAMTVDAYDNVYVTGTVSVDLGSDCVTIKYNSAGNQQWLRTFNGGRHDLGLAISVDDLGNVYVAGSIQSYAADFLTIKYDSSGAEQWARFYDGPITEEDVAVSIAVDPAGNVYVAGYSTGDGTSYDYATVKYSATGDEQWVRRFDIGGGEDAAADLALGPSGIMVTGRSNYDYATIKYGFDGAQQWVRTYAGPGGSSDSPSAIKVDAAGNSYVTGMSTGVGTNFDYATVKYDPAGTELWVRRYDGPSTQFQVDYDYASSLALDPAGNVFVTGNSSDDFATVKYDNTGNELWARRYGPAATLDYAYAIAVDGLGNAYVTGISYGDGTTLYDYATLSYDPSGGQRWVERYNGPGNFYDTPYSVAVDASGAVYVSGQSGGDGTGLDLATIKYSQAAAGAPEPPSLGSHLRFGLRIEPNPFSHAATIRFAVLSSAAGLPTPTRLAIYNVQGQEIAVLVDEALAPGTHARELDGRALPSGVYYSVLRVGGVGETRRLIRVK